MGKRLITIRTLGGCGELALESGDPITLGGGTLVMVEQESVRKYRQVKGLWHFWWFEFDVCGPMFFPLGQKLNVPVSRFESVWMKDLFQMLRKESSAQRSLASAGFAHLLHRWLASAQEQQHPHPNREKVVAAIEFMYAHADGSLGIETMARRAGLSERRFRQVFREVTGQSPKRFYNNLRLELGRQLLMSSPAKLESISEQLGFSSSFHFSRSFRMQFGVPPSRVRFR